MSLEIVSPPQSNQLPTRHQPFTNFLNNWSVLPGSVSHVPHYSRDLGEKGGVQEVQVLDKRNDSAPVFTVWSSQVKFLHQRKLGLRGNFSNFMSAGRKQVKMSGVMQ